ncbi:MAG: acyltransferase domain-containing protein, partial [Proteobacteria bacterium]|nr:acyltransferase domain-containing protein [Pseudomonadota bacterium]
GSVVFVFPGQGSQWAAMGRALLEESEAFADAIAACDAALLPHTGWSVTSVLRGDEGEDVPPLVRVDVVQPVLFAMGVGLAAAWRSLGLEPAAVVGHSVGEIAAAVVCGALSLEDGAQLVAVRGQRIASIPDSGAMLSVQLPEAEVAERLAPWGEVLTIGVVNGPDSAVVSGEASAIAELESTLQADGVFCRRVRIGFAAHSTQMDGVLEGLEAALSSLRPGASTVPFYSSVTGGPLDGASLDAAYWCRNVRDTVRFDAVVQSLLSDGHGVFVEQGGHPVLTLPLTEACVETAGVVVGSLRRDEGALATLHRTLGVLHTQGHPVDWAALHGESSGAIAALPTYAFQRQRYWLEATASVTDASDLGLSSAAHPLLGAATPLADSDGFLFTGRLSVSDHRWLADHTVFDTVLVPGTGLLELVLAAGRTVGCTTVSDLTLAAPLVLPERGAVRVQLHVEAPDGQGHRTVALYSR